MTQAIVTSDAAFLRVEKVLDFIHQHLDQPLSIDAIAAESCWSRWQLQRVFQAHVGKSVAGYVRELKLSRAAEAVLDGHERVIDIATRMGFSSEISFSRSFKQQFQQSPRAYRNSGRRRGLVQPTQASEMVSQLFAGRRRFIEVRVESDVELSLAGISTTINGMFSASPNFSARVPRLWGQLDRLLPIAASEFKQLVGAIDLTNSHAKSTNLTYWATVEQDELQRYQKANGNNCRLKRISVPKQTYAVIQHRGPVAELPATLMWFLVGWLPSSSYQSMEGIELEKYPSDYDVNAESATMEYWLPIA